MRDGYTILMPMPSDMPFLLRFALEGLRAMDTTHCNQIVVIPDGFSDDGAQALSYLKRFGSVTVLNGHIHQVMQKVEGNVAFNTER